MKIRAFTIIEISVMIALMGIAVIAAFVIAHNYINKGKAKTLQSQFKSAYSQISQAAIQTQTDIGINSLYDYCTSYDSQTGFYNSNECKNEIIKHLPVKGKLENLPFKNYKTYDGSKAYGTSNDSTYITIPDNVLKNGNYISIDINGNEDERYISFWIDINGASQPNKAGFDLFNFVILGSDNKVTGRKMSQLYTEKELKDIDNPDIAGFPCSKQSIQKANGIGCTWYAISNICPDNKEKRYWECLFN